MKQKAAKILILLPVSWWGYRMIKKYALTDEQKEIDLMARTIYGEARGEGENGMQAVANVIMNRVNAGAWYGRTVEEVVKKPRQFSCWNDGDPNKKVIETVNSGNSIFARALQIAKNAYYGKIQDLTLGATHYHAANIVPTWAGDLIQTIKIGSHVFYKEVL